MRTFVIKQIHWPASISGGLKRSPNSRQSPEKKIVYSMPDSKSGRPKREWHISDDGTLSKIHDCEMSAWVHQEDDGRWFWTPVNSVSGSFRVWDSFEIELDEED